MPPYPPVLPESGKDFTKIIHKDTYEAINPITKSDCTGKYVFITGTSKGCGRALAISYAKAGASAIAISARSPLDSLITEIKAAAESAGKNIPKILAIKLDVEDKKSVDAAVIQTEKEFGRLDILINNAGYLENFSPIVEGDAVEWWKTWEVNVRGVYWVTKGLLPLMMRSAGGDMTVVNLTSIGALNLRAGGSGYQTSKFAILKLTEFFNLEYAERGVLAYAVHPGGVVTELALHMPENMHHVLTDTAELSADTMVFLTSEKRDWLAGRYIACPWDMPEFLSREKEIVEGDKLKMRMVF